MQQEGTRSLLYQPESPCAQEAEGHGTVFFPNRSCRSPAALGDAAGTSFLLVLRGPMLLLH